MQMLTTSSLLDGPSVRLSFGVAAKLPSHHVAAPNPATLYTMANEVVRAEALALPECDPAWACTAPMDL